MHRSLTLVAAVLLTACAPAPGDDYAAVLPDERLLVDFPDGGTLRSAAGDPSEYHALTSQVTHDVNLLIETVLTSIAYVTEFDPTWADESARVALWGPWTDDGVDGRLWVEHHDDGSYTWAVEGRPEGAGDDAWIALIAGEIEPGATDTAGAGAFALDFDAIGALDPEELTTGAFFVEYDIQEDHVAATAGFSGFSEEEGQLADAAYFYDQTVGVEGYMDLVVATDITGNETKETQIVRSRWLASGEGRGDAYVTGGDLGALVYQASECWDTSHQVVFYEDNAELVTSGDESMCAFGEAEFNESGA